MKNKVVSFFILLCISLWTPLLNSEAAESARPKILAVIDISILKCGTSLLQKCLRLISEKEFSKGLCTYPKGIPADYGPHVGGPFLSIRKGLKKLLHSIDKQHQKLFINCRYPFEDEMKHLPFNQENAKILNNPHIVIFLITRDPRDQCVSYAYWKKKVFPKSCQGLSIDSLILDGIERGAYRGIPIWRCNIADLYDRYLKWLQLDNVVHITFEALVGPAGEGDRERQIQEIKKISLYAGCDLDDGEINEIADQLFGETSTFREGKIGSWKKEFNIRHEQAFKKNKAAMQLLIDLGYEYSFDW